MILGTLTFFRFPREAESELDVAAVVMVRRALLHLPALATNHLPAFGVAAVADVAFLYMCCVCAFWGALWICVCVSCVQRWVARITCFVIVDASHDYGCCKHRLVLVFVDCFKTWILSCLLAYRDQSELPPRAPLSLMNCVLFPLYRYMFFPLLSIGTPWHPPECRTRPKKEGKNHVYSLPKW